MVSCSGNIARTAAFDAWSITTIPMTRPPSSARDGTKVDGTRLASAACASIDPSVSAGTDRLR